MRKLAFAVLGAVSLAVGAAYGGAAVDIKQKDKAFAPAEISIGVGTKLRFVNDDTVVHNVYANDNGLQFDLGSQPPGDVKEVAFDKAGTFEIHCAIHPKMSLTVNVK